MTSKQRIDFLEAVNSIEDFEQAKLFINGIEFNLTSLYFEIDLRDFELQNIDNGIVAKIEFEKIIECWLFDGRANHFKELYRCRNL